MIRSLLCLVLAAAVFAGCGEASDDSTSNDPSGKAKSASASKPKSVLDTTKDAYGAPIRKWVDEAIVELPKAATEHQKCAKLAQSGTDGFDVSMCSNDAGYGITGLMGRVDAGLAEAQDKATGACKTAITKALAVSESWDKAEFALRDSGAGDVGGMTAATTAFATQSARRESTLATVGSAC